MAGNVRFESNSVSPEELSFAASYPNGLRGNYPNANLHRSGSFREGSEGRMFNSGASTPRASSSPVRDVPSLTHYLLLDPIIMSDQKYTRLGELRMALGMSLGSATEDNSFGVGYSKPFPPVATEELKRIRANVLDGNFKARGRVKRLNESLLRLNKYCEALSLNKQLRNEMLTNERSGGSNFLKMGIQIHRNPSDLGTQRFEDRTKNIVLNKRVRSSVAESRADSRSNTLQRQPLVMGKDRDMFRDGGESSDLTEEKVRRLPAGGEGWDRKMKRKRSIGTVFTRSADSDGEVKRVMHNKFNNGPGLQSYDAQGFRSGSFNGGSGINKLDGISSAAGSNARGIPKSEPVKVSLTRDFAASVNKERPVAKGNNKINIPEDNNVVSPGPVTKGKASRAPRTGSVMAANSSPNFSRMSGAPDGWEQNPGINKVNSVGGPNNRKRPMPTGSSSPPMAQWVGQRSQKSSRTRRANVVSPISNHDEVQMSSEGGQTSDFATRITSVGIHGSLPAKDLTNGTPQVRMKLENVSSPARLSESEESGAGENHGHEGHRPKDKGAGSGGVEERSLNQNVVPSMLLTKKNKTLNKEDINDSVRRQGRTGRVASSSKANSSPTGEKLESPASTKPLRSARPVSDKNGSKSGRPPLKKISDRKAFTRVGQIPTGGSPDFSGESDDDREELLAAANFACNASYLSCSDSFWKKMEPVFTSIWHDDLVYLKQQLQSAEELHESLSETFGHGNYNLCDIVHEEDFQSQLVSEEKKRSLQEQVQPKKSGSSLDLVDEGRDHGTPCERSNRRNKVAPLYQRVLSALIVEDESEEFEENKGGRSISFQCGKDGPSGHSRLGIDFEPGNRDGTELDYNSFLGFQTQKQSSVDGFPCNGRTTINRSTDFHNYLYNDDLFEGGHAFKHSKVVMLPGNFENNDGKPVLYTNGSVVSDLDCQYEQLCLEDKVLMELRSVGLYPEAVPDLTDGEEEAIIHDITELQKGLQQQARKKKEQLNKIIQAIEEAKELEVRSLEQVAVNKLVELAYRKQLHQIIRECLSRTINLMTLIDVASGAQATRGSNALKFGVPKVSKQVSLAFTRRTLAKCRKFEDTGKSCFSEPPLRDVIFAAPLWGNETESTSCVQDPGASGSFSIRAEGHDLHHKNFGRGASDAIGTLMHPCDQDFAKTGPITNRGKKKEVLLDDVSGNCSLRATSSLSNTLLVGAKGKRSERERDKDVFAKNSVTKAGRASHGNIKGDRKSKAKPKQKTAQLPTSGDGMINKLKETSSNKKRDTGVTSLCCSPLDSSKEGREMADTTDLQELDSLELHVAGDFDGSQDLSSLFSFDGDGLPENDLASLDIPMDDLPMDGLEIPMDDLSELNIGL